MTSKEINDIIEEKAKAYGFEAETEEGIVPSIKHGKDDYVSLLILLTAPKVDMKHHVTRTGVTAKASICQMGGDTTPADLIAAADQIRRGAMLAAEIQKLGLFYEMRF